MNTNSWLFLLAALVLQRAHGQVTTITTAPVAVEAGPHHRVWQTVRTDGSRAITNSYSELATGLNYFQDGNWLPTEEQFQTTKDGHAVANKGQHHVTLAADINSGGSVELITPDGQRLLSNPMGLSFHDLVSGKNVLIAELTSCVGELVAPNEVVYVNAFDTITAAIRYKNTKAGLSQDIILYQNPGSPADYGLDPATTVLEMFTEFFDPPAPTVQQGSEADQTVCFGQMQFARGAAYLLNGSSQSLEELPVTKEWTQIQDRHFLIEAVPYQQVKLLLDNLQAGVSRENKDAVALRVAPNREKLVALEGMKPKARTKVVASIKTGQSSPRDGLVLDYTTVNTSQTNFSFVSGSTYYISGPVALYGTGTVFQAACVVKYAPTNTAKLTINTPISWKGEPYRPVVLTARDDPTVGEFIGYNPLSGYYADTALEINATNSVTLGYLRIVNAKNGIVLSGSTGHVISHAQLVNCQTGIKPSSADFSLRNALFYNVLTNFNGTSSTGRCEHMTVNGGSWLNYNSGMTLYVTNSLLAAVTNWGTLAVTNSTAVISSSSGVFQSVGAGYNYLPTSSTNRDAGTTNINTNLLQDLRNKTTEAPPVWTNLLTTNTTFSPQVRRDTGLLDRGFHYDAIDYAVGIVTVSNATLSVTVANPSLGVTNSTAIANFGPYAGGIYLRGEASLCAEGTANFPIRFTRFVTVQEQPYEWGGSNTNVPIIHVSPNTTGSVAFRFCRLDHYPLGVGFYAFYLGPSSWYVNSLLVRDSELFQGRCDLTGGSWSAVTPSISFVNNVFENCILGTWSYLKVDAYNNLFHLGEFYSFRLGTNTWTAKDNAFDNCAISDFGSPWVNDYNAYINTGGTTLQSPGSHSITNLSSFTYTAGPPGNSLGNYYQYSTNLYDKGSRSASAANLSDYTVTTNQVKEGGTVDIGYHYVALTNGVPFDSDANGIPDYIQNRSTQCYCELTCSAPSVILLTPTNTQFFAQSPTNIVLTAQASDSDGTILHVDYFNASTLIGTAYNASDNYLFVWTNIGAGNYTFKAMGTDNHLLTGTSTVSSNTVNGVPAVQMFNPTNNQILVGPLSITLNAWATDSDGISSVQFYTNGVFLGSGFLSAPTNYLYTNIFNPGRFSVHAKATDTKGGVRLSPLVDFTVNSTNDYPLISINSPTNGSSFKAWSDVTITAGASDASGISRVDFFSSSDSLGSDTNATTGTNYSITVRGLKPGQYNLTAKATDNSNPAARNLSAPLVSITVNAPEPTGIGFWDPTFGRLIPEQGKFHEQCLDLDSSGNLYSGSAYLETGPPVRILKWAGCAWSTPVFIGPGSGFGYVYSLRWYGTDLYFGGTFSGFGADYIAKLSGTNISRVGNGLDFAGSSEPDWPSTPGVNTIQPMDGDLYIGGAFTSAGNDTNIQFIAKLAGVSTNWSRVGSNSLKGTVRAIAEYGDTIYVGGDFTNSTYPYLAKLVNGQWQAVGSGVNGPVRALTAHRGRLFVGGDFTTAGGLTNANCIACWDGNQWRTINSGVSGGQRDNPNNPQLADTRVDGIAARGNDIYVTGDFTNAWNGTVPVLANYVGKASWSENDQSWSWSALDGGLSWNAGGLDYPVHGRAIVIRERTNSAGYDVIVAGVFTHAGGLPNNDLARWIVGVSECPTNGPTVNIAYPHERDVLTGTNFTFSAAATTTGTNTITGVIFFLNGALSDDGIYNSGTTNWEFSVSDLVPGPYSINAVATDSQTNSASSAPVNFTVRAATGPTGPAVTNDVFHVFSTGAATNLNVLDNDRSTNGPMRIVGVNKWQNPFTTVRFGSVRIGYGATNLLYQANPYNFGTSWISYDVANNDGTNSGIATVIVHALPQVMITSPTNDPPPYTNTPVNLTVAGKSKDYDGTISNVTLYVNGVSNSIVTTTNAFSFGWTNSTPGFYSFVAVARDNDGFTNSSASVTITIDPPGGSPPFAKIVNLINDSTNFTTLTLTNYPLIRDGLFTVLGSAYDTDGDAITRQVLLFRPGEKSAFANVTAGTLDYAGFTSGSVTNGNLGTLNLSAIPNGVYDMGLVVRSRGDQVLDLVRFALDNQLKIGAFTFSEQDLIIPVNGIPLTVIRTYNSLNQVNADFGYNWTYALNDMDVTIDEDREPAMAFERLDNDGYDATTEYFSLRTGGGRNVALTLPGGQRTTFLFKPVNRITYYTAEWQSAPGVTAILTMLGNNVINFFGGLSLHDPFFAAGESRTPFEAFDIEGYRLAMKDGTIYELHREPALPGAPWISWDYGEGSGDYRPVNAYSGKPKLTLITQPTQDKIVITNTGIYHQNPTNGVTRTVWFERDPNSNRIRAIRDPISGSNGLPVVKYIYNEDTGNLIQVLRLVDRSTSSYVTNRYRYDHPTFTHYITTIENAAGVPITRNEYDAYGRLEKVTDADGQSIRYIHDTTNRVEQVVDRLTNTNSFGYDTRGNVIVTTNALQQVTRMGYDDNNNKLAQTNALQQVTSWLYDTNNFLLQTVTAVNALNLTNSFAYDTNGRPSTVVDALGRVTTNAYDTSGNLTNIADSVGSVVTNFFSNGLLQSSKDPLGTSTVCLYDPYGNATNITVTNSSGTVLSKTSAAYDSNNNQITNVVTRTLPGGATTNQTTSYFYDAQNRLTQTVGPDGSTSFVVFDVAGRQSLTIDQLGHTNRYDYDAQGRLKTRTDPDNLNETHTYDAEGRRTNSVDRAGRVTRTGYDALGRATSVSNAWNTADQAVTRTIFDEAGRVKYSVDAMGVTNAFGYDTAGRRTSVTNAWGTTIAQTNMFAYDATGNQTNVTDSLNRITEFRYDARNRRTQTILPAVVAGGPKFTNNVAYDVADRRTFETNALGIISQFSYDGVGRLLSVTNGLASGTATNWATYAYDEAGNLTNQVDALNRATGFTYDSLGRRLSRKLPGGQTTSFTYDPVGNLMGTTTADNVTITNQYDVMNRLWKRGQTGTNFETYAYSASGHLTNRVDASGTHTWVYDLLGRVRTNTTPVGTLYYTYDVGGNLLTLGSGFTSGVTNQFQYDALGRLTNVVDIALTNSTKNTGYGFDAVGNLQWIKLNPIAATPVTNYYQYDAQNRLTNLLWKAGGTTLASFGYTLNSVGSRTQLSQSLSNQPTTFNWSYDALQRLTSESVPSGTPNGTLSYTFDLVGNRKTRSAALGLTSQTLNYDWNDWLDDDATTNDATIYFDAKGNTRTNVWDGAARQYGYDWANRLTTYTNGATTATMAYDADGNRIKKAVGGTTNWYLVATVNPTGYPQVVEERTGSSPTTLSRRYTYGLDLISQTTGTTNRFFGTDGLGSTRFLVIDGGSLLEHYGYDAYGTIIVSNAAPSTIYLFAGEQWDPDLGLYYNRARYLNVGLGRFSSCDSFEGNNQDPLSLHKYLYAGDNPVNLIDPSGHDGSYTAVGQVSIGGIQFNSRTLEGVGVAAFQAGAVRGISGFILKTGAYGILALTGAGIAGEIAQITELISKNPAAATSPQARQQLQQLIESEEQSRSDQILFHYTSASAAAEIRQDNAIEASEKKIFLGNSFPSGAYATDIPPWSSSYTRRQVSALFYGGNEGRDVNWFVAIERNDFTPLALPGFPNQWIRYSPAGSKVSVNIVGIGPNLMSP